jgi:hypothetical protein
VMGESLLVVIGSSMTQAGRKRTQRRSGEAVERVITRGASAWLIVIVRDGKGRAILFE